MENSETLNVIYQKPCPLSLRDMVGALCDRGVEVGYGTLAEFVKQGDIEELLGVGGAGNRREFPPAAIDVLAAFLPMYHEAKGRLPQAPGMLRSFLDRGENALIPVRVSEFSETVKHDARELAVVQGRSAGLAQAEQVLTAKEAADRLKLSVRLLRRTVKPWRRFGNSARGDRWLFSRIVGE